MNDLHPIAPGYGEGVDAVRRGWGNTPDRFILPKTRITSVFRFVTVLLTLNPAFIFLVSQEGRLLPLPNRDTSRRPPQRACR